MSDDFDPEFDKLTDLPPTIIGGDKSAAAWHGADTDLSILDKVTASYDEALREARAERDALAHVIERLAVAHDKWDGSNDTIDDLLEEVEVAVSETRAREFLALHDAEVKAQALDEAKQIVTTVCRDELSDYYGQVRVEVNAALDRRSAAIRADAK